MSKEEYIALKADIDRFGLMEPIWTYEGKIIDGRHRFKACQELGIEPMFQEWQGENLIDFIVSLNLYRRHLTTSQRAAIALSILPELEKQAKERQGMRTDLAENFTECSGRSTEKAAERFSTNELYVRQAKKLQGEAPDLLEDVKNGRFTIPQAITKLNERIHKTIDEKYPITQDQAYGEIGFACLCDAMQNAANGKQKDQEWLADKKGGEFFSNALGLKYSIIMDWLEGGCDNRTLVEILIEILRKQFDEALLERA